MEARTEVGLKPVTAFEHAGFAADILKACRRGVWQSRASKPTPPADGGWL